MRLCMIVLAKWRASPLASPSWWVMTCWVYNGRDCHRGTPMKACQCHEMRAGKHNHTSFLPNRPLLTCSTSPRYESNSSDLVMSWPVRVMSLQLDRSERGRIFSTHDKGSRKRKRKKRSLLGSCDNALCKKHTYIKLGASGAIWKQTLASLWATMSISRPWSRAGEHTRTSSLMSWSSLSRRLGNPFAHKHFGLLLRDHPWFATIFRHMGSKCKVGGVVASDVSVDRREANSFNGHQQVQVNISLEENQLR